MSSIPFTPFRPSNATEAAAGLAIQVTDLFHKLQGALPLETVLRRDEPLARRTTLRVGGPADIFVEPDCDHALVTVLELAAQMEVPVFVLGRGSNLLIRDGGVRGVVFQCGAGARLKAIATEARRAGVAGLEFLEGIPGSLGGALRMNAGAMNSWTFNVVERLRYVTRAGVIQDVPAAEVPATYRSCPLLREAIALGALLRGTPDEPEAVRARMDAYSRKRWDSQPNQPSAGCTFKNPAPTLPAGKLIDELGLKGTRVGDAMVSDVHANFFVNLGNASARDVLQLIEVVRQRAREARGVELEVEVEVLGEDLL